MHSLKDGNPTRPWYREPWTWFLISLPATAVIAGFVTYWLAATTDDGLVVDDYYKQGLAVNQVIARDRLAAQLGLRAEVSLADGLVSINLQAASGRLPEIILVSLIHPTRAGEDQVLKLAGHNGTYGGALAQMAPGHWQISIEDESRSWRMNGTADLPAETTIRIESVNSDS